MIDKITRVPIKQVWEDEAGKFTPWLMENISVLNDVLDFDIKEVSREQTSGNFYVDLLAQDNSGHTVIIENQLDKSDHKHLGQIIE